MDVAPLDTRRSDRYVAAPALRTLECQGATRLHSNGCLTRDEIVKQVVGSPLTAAERERPSGTANRRYFEQCTFKKRRPAVRTLFPSANAAGQSTERLLQIPGEFS
jgi:hypothetical protein